MSTKRQSSKITLTLSRPANKPAGVWQIYRRLFKFGREFGGMFIFALIANFLYAGVDASFTYFLKPLLDQGFIARNRDFLFWVPLTLLGLFGLRATFNIVGNYCMAWVGRSVVMKFRQAIFHHYLHLPARFFDQNATGQLLSLVTYNTAQVANACTEAVSTSLQSIFLIVGLIVVMFSISWQLSLIFFLTMPATMLVVRLMSRRLRKLNQLIQETMGWMTHIAEEMLESFKVIRIFGGESWEQEKFRKATKENAKQEMKVVITKSVNISVVQFLGVMALAGMIMVATRISGGYLLTAGGFAAMMAAMLALLKPLRELTNVNTIIQRGLAGAESIFELLAEPCEADTGTRELQHARGEICFRDVSFNYPTVSRAALNHINFTVQPGKTVAIVGRSGAGKSTLVNLLPRFYELTSGEIQLDGITLTDYRLTDLRRQFAMVSQHVTLFNDTLAHNVAYGHFEYSEAQIWDAVQAAHLGEWVAQLPEGLNTPIGENGILLSGGQRQRLAIARAILKNAPILILDEATSSLDSESERAIQLALQNLMHARTTLVIAHRLSTIERADQIIVLDQGEIKEMGTHAELIALGGHYAHLQHLQQQTQSQVSTL
jgi:subfamily B ATP-binding cassette protein MsbA